MNLVNENVLNAAIDRIITVYAPDAPGVRAALTIVLIDFFRDALTKLVENKVVTINIIPRDVEKN